MSALRQRMTEDMQLRNLALNTQISYLLQVSCFARHFGKSPAELGEEEILRLSDLSDHREEAFSRFDTLRRCGPSLPLQGHPQKALDR